MITAILPSRLIDNGRKYASRNWWREGQRKLELKMWNECKGLSKEKQSHYVWERLKSHYFARGTLTIAKVSGIPGNQEH